MDHKQLLQQRARQLATLLEAIFSIFRTILAKHYCSVVSAALEDFDACMQLS
jgi:hypothetical protein